MIGECHRGLCRDAMRTKRAVEGWRRWLMTWLTNVIVVVFAVVVFLVVVVVAVGVFVQEDKKFPDGDG